MKKVLLILSVAGLASCSAPVSKPVEPDIVVDGWIASGQAPVVKVTTGIIPSAEYQDIEGLSDHIMKWAKVTVSDGENSVVLFGKPDDRYFPPYIYTTGRITGEPGKTYTLIIEYERKIVSATTTIPEAGSLVSLRPVKDANGKYALVAGFSIKPEEKKYYRIQTLVEGVDTEFRSSFPVTLSSDELRENAEVTIQRASTVYDITHGNRFSEGDVVHVRLCTMDENSWLFWNGIDSVIMQSLPIFVSSRNLVSNVRDGLGIWAGYGITDYTITIRDQE